LHPEGKRKKRDEQKRKKLTFSGTRENDNNQPKGGTLKKGQGIYTPITGANRQKEKLQEKEDSPETQEGRGKGGVVGKRVANDTDWPC